MLRLDKRLQAVVNETQGDILADIGCDHGKVSVACLMLGKINRVIASDISSPSLQKAKELAQKCNVEDKIQFICCNGFEDYPKLKIDVCVIAGMGAYEIIDILENQPSSINKYILLAHRDEQVLRQYLQDNNKTIVKDYVIFCKNHYYNLIVATNGKQTLTPIQLLLPI